MKLSDNVYDLDTYPKRVYRFVPELEGALIAKLQEGNVLLIDRAKFDALTRQQQELVYVARGDMEVEPA